MNRKLPGLIVMLAASLSFAGACGGQTAEKNDKLGGETNWLGDCSMTGQCDVGQCICGLCTEHCTTDEDCGGDGTAMCVSSNGLLFQATCGDTPDAQSVCIGHCVTDADCSDGTTCVAGACLAQRQVSRTAEPTTATMINSVFVDDVGSFEQSSADLSGVCLSRPLTTTDGSAPCVVLHATTGATCDCARPGLAPASSAEAIFAAEQLAISGRCGVQGTAPCDEVCLCEMTQATGAALDACLTDEQSNPVGWCYIDDAVGDPAFLHDCPDTQQQLIRFSSFDTGVQLVVCGTSSRAPDFQAPAPAPLGDFCMPPDEYRTDFGGFDDFEVNVVSRYPGCQTGICLVHHFRGRVTCPYGTEEGGTCATPTGDPVTVPVVAQLQSRPPEDAVLCSCRCDGPDPDADYCACPDGFECHELVPDVEFADPNDVGSYCIKSGTYVADPSQIAGTSCSLGAAQYCE